jgi:hypothetical protein
MKMPTLTNTIGAETTDFSEIFEKMPYAKIRKAAKAITGYSVIIIRAL